MLGHFGCPECDASGRCTLGCTQEELEGRFLLGGTPTPEKSLPPLSEALRAPTGRLRMKVGGKYWFYYNPDNRGQDSRKMNVECIWLGEMNGELTAVCLRQTLNNRVCIERYDPVTGLSREQRLRSPLQGLEPITTPSLEWV